LTVQNCLILSLINCLKGVKIFLLSYLFFDLILITFYFMKLSQSEVEHIATLARLRLSAEEKEKYSGQLSAILDYMEKLQTVDTTSVEPTSQVTGLTNVMRPDEIIESGIAEELVAGAPSHQNGYVVIPKIFDNK